MKPTHLSAPRSAARGFSLIELMVSMAIALMVIVAMTLVSARFEASKRQDATTSDMATNAGYLAYDFDRQVRSAGSGFSATARGATFGCPLYASKSNVQILPAPAAFPAPFTTVSTTVRMIPVLVHAGAGANGSDVLQIMTGTGGIGETSSQVSTKSAQNGSLRLTTTTGIRGDDLLLISETGRPCMIEQVDNNYSGGPSQQVDLAGTYYASSIGSESILSRSNGGVANANATVLGNASNGNPPKLMLLGVNAANQLVRYDLLRFSNGASEAPVPLTDGVVDMRIRYGVDTTAAINGTVDAWVPATGNTYGAAALNSNTGPAQDAMSRILALKVSLVLRSEFRESDQGADIAPATLSMFPSLPASDRVTYTVADRKRRHRVLEFTIPLRNPIASSGR